MHNEFGSYELIMMALAEQKKAQRREAKRRYNAKRKSQPTNQPVEACESQAESLNNRNKGEVSL